MVTSKEAKSRLFKDFGGVSKKVGVLFVDTLFARVFSVFQGRAGGGGWQVVLFYHK